MLVKGATGVILIGMTMIWLFIWHGEIILDNSLPINLNGLLINVIEYNSTTQTKI